MSKEQNQLIDMEGYENGVREQAVQNHQGAANQIEGPQA